MMLHDPIGHLEYARAKHLAAVQSANRLRLARAVERRSSRWRHALGCSLRIAANLLDPETPGERARA
jgi:hypothetical protein